MTKKPKILIADDDPLLLDAMVTVLSRAGYDCTRATDADEGIQRLTEKRYDLVVSDVNMPGNEGLRLVREVRRIAGRIPVILFTGEPAAAYATAAAELQVRACLTKTDGIWVLRDQIAAIVALEAA